MTRNTRIMSMLLVVFMLIGMLASLSILPVFADEEEAPETGAGGTEVIVDAGEQPETSGTDNEQPGETSDDPGETAVDPDIPATPEIPDTPDEPAKEITLTIEEAIEAYLTTVYESAEDKLSDMRLRLTKGDYAMYVEESTGEVAFKNTKTGQIILSNPYDVYKISSDNVKAEILSQVVVSFRDITNNNQSRTMYSYSESAQRGQITVRNIMNGIRVEYVLGKQSAKKLMPYWMEATRFEQLIINKIAAEGEEAENDLRRFFSYYALYDPNDSELPESVITEMKTNYPCTGKSYYSAAETIHTYDRYYQQVDRIYSPGDNMAIYVIDSKMATSERNTNYLEGIVKQYCPEYNYEELDYDIELTGYTGDDAAAAIFTVAIEWYLDDYGFYYTVPTNSITYDEDTYQLDYFAINSYLGCTNVSRDGYTFFPDGSGTVIYNDDIGQDNASYTIAAEVYGPDYSYHNLFYTGKSEIITMPVFGVIDNTEYIRQGELIKANAPVWQPKLDEYGDKIYNEDGTIEYEVDAETGEKIPVYKTVDESKVTKVEADEEAGTPESYHLTDDPDQKVVLEENVYYIVDENGDKIQDRADLYEQFVYSIPQGYVAIIEEGESLARVAYTYGGISHKYCTVYSTLRPVQSDTYNLAEAISVANNTTWTVTSERKYTGKFKVKYYMLYGDPADTEHPTDYKYEGSYVGMAEAYRDYLEANGSITRLTDTKTDIPIYIESFGKIETQDTILTMPVWVDTPLTTFEDVAAMYKTLSENTEYAIKNINFRLVGYNDGNLDRETYPTYIKFERVVGGNKGYNKLVKEAKEQGFGLYPDFDFANVANSRLFGGFRYSKWTIRTIDDRYARKREYDAVYQSFQYTGRVLVSPAYYDKVFDKFAKAFGKLEYSGLSVGSLGADLNSDFDRDEPYSREDNKAYTAELLAKLQETYGDDLMTDRGNAYTWRYVKHILGMTLDSSRYLRATASVPFLGMVLHGYKYICGTPTNMEGNMEYEILKLIENGANPYFTLSYQNTQELKERYPDYYSVDFNIWISNSGTTDVETEIKNLGLIEAYKILNEALKDVQTARIIDHEYVRDGRAKRILTKAEETYLETARAEALAAYEKAKAEAETAYNNSYVHALTAAKAAHKEAWDGAYAGKADSAALALMYKFYVEYMTAARSEDFNESAFVTEFKANNAGSDFTDAMLKEVRLYAAYTAQAAAADEDALDFDEDAFIAAYDADGLGKADIRAILNVYNLFGAPVYEDEFKADYVEANGEEEFLEFEEYYEEEISTVVTDYTVVFETYENGVKFVLNYNNFDITFDYNGTTYTVESMNFVKISA